MIEIIKHGRYNDKHYITCPYCGCEFSYTQEDVIRGGISCSSALSNYISCPDCDHLINIYAYGIPVGKGFSTTVTRPEDNTATLTINPNIATIDYETINTATSKPDPNITLHNDVQNSNTSGSADDITAAKDAITTKKDNEYAEKLMKEWRRKEYRIRKPFYDFSEELSNFDRIFDNWLGNFKNEKTPKDAATTNEANSDKDNYIAGTIIITDENGTKTYNWNNKTKNFELDKE